MVICTWVYLVKPCFTCENFVLNTKSNCSKEKISFTAFSFISHARQQGIRIELLSYILQKSTHKSLHTYICIFFRHTCRYYFYSSVGDPDPDPQARIILGLLDPDPDPLVRGTDPDPALDPDPAPDPSLFS
jgi:hypothetical protein